VSGNRTPRLDLLALAEDIVAGRRSLDNVIDQIAVATADDRQRRRAVAELQSLVVALTGITAHAQATAASAAGSEPATHSRDLLVAPRPVHARPSRFGFPGSLAVAGSVVVAVVIVAVILVSLRPAASSVGGPSLSASSSTLASGSAPSTGPSASSSSASALPSAARSDSAAPSAPSTPPSSTSASSPGSPAPLPSPSPADSPSVPPATPVVSPVPTAAAGLPEIPSSPVGGPGSFFWSLTAPDQLQLWLWNPSLVRMQPRLTTATWSGATIQRTVLVAPDGVHVAIQEVDSSTNAPVQRLRIMTLTGNLVWTAPKLPLVTTLAWSGSGHELAIGSLPVPWTVVDLNDGAAPTVKTYHLDNQDGYALLGFSDDGATLFGYGTGGEAEFWQKPVAVDVATGTLTHLTAFPGSDRPVSLANSTAPVGQIDRDGRVIALAGGAKGDLHWATLKGSVESAVAVGNDAQLTWGLDGSLVGLSRSPVGDPNGLAVRRFDATGREIPDAVPLRAGSYAAVLIGSRNGVALVSLIPIAVQGEPQPVREVLLVDPATGRIAVGLPPAAEDGAGFTFAGWVSGLG
jgi:hypothetical protein